MVAIPLFVRRLAASDYEDEIANDPRVDAFAFENASQGKTQPSPQSITGR